MMPRIKRLLTDIIWYAKTCPSQLWRLVKFPQYYNCRNTYYPEVERRKSSIRIFCEQLACVLRHGELNDFYFLYGFDLKNRSQRKEYIQHCTFRSLRNAKNNSSYFNEMCVLRNKELFSIVGKGFGMPVLSTIGEMRNGNISVNGNEAPLMEYLQDGMHLFCKPLDAECGQGIFSLDKKGGCYYLNDKLEKESDVCQYIKSVGGRYMVQERLVQHAEMSRIFPNSVNTIRIITIRDRLGAPRMFSSLLRVGTGSNVVDNWAKGGLAIGIANEDGRLNEYGYYKPPYGTKTKVHPDTKVVFSEFVIPYYRQAVETCLLFHEKLSTVHSIGWDVAISLHGPVLVEGNDNYEISLNQACDKGMKRALTKLLK